MKAPLKILIDARMVHAQTHGIARYTVELIQGLAKLDQKISIITHSPDTADFIGREFIQGEVPCRAGFLNPTELVELSLLKAYKNFDIVHFPSFALPLRIPARTVISIHDLIHLYKPSRLFHHVYYQTVVRHALLKCDQIITGAQWSKREIYRLLGAPLNKISVVRDGVQDSWFTKYKTAAPLDGPYFLCLSNSKYSKNVPTLLKACQKLWTEGLKFKLALSLGGQEFENSWNLSATDKEKILLISGIGDLELKAFFLHCQAVVSPSFFEGYNYPAAEALALDIPVILSCGSANDEFYGPLVNHYGQPGDANALGVALRRALHEEKSNRLLSEKYRVPTAQDMARETLEVYRKTGPEVYLRGDRRQ